MSGYVPRKGDLITLSFDPQTGHEQQGRRPALVVSNDLFNRGTGLCMVCPVTRTARQHPFHVPVPEGGRITGVVMSEQLKSLDYRARDARHVDAAPQELLDEVLAILDAVLY
ncbi:MAG: type II toxin-antitoxin system PemK/MazF family toxin [Coriobacteriia bacterium]